MKHSYTERITRVILSFGILFAVLSLSVTKASANGCVIFQQDDAAVMHLSSGTVGQSFMPCRTGTLEYITLYAGSGNEESFAADLTIRQGQRVLTHQQIVIPPNYREHYIKVRLAEQVVVETDKPYQLELSIPEHQTVFISHSEEDRYGNGQMTLNGTYINGDLTFEAGVKSYVNKSPVPARNVNCTPQQMTIDEHQDVFEIVAQTFTTCEPIEVLGITAYYKSNVELFGKIDIYKAGVADDSPLGTLGFFAPAGDQGQVIAEPVARIQLEAADLYEFRFRLDAFADVNDYFILGIGHNDPYTEGALVTLSGMTENDLAFDLIFDELEEIDEEEVDDFSVFTDYQEHDCTVIQPYYNHTHNFTNTTLRIEIPVCDDGRLEAVYFPGSIDGNGQGVTYTLLDDRDRIARSGALTEADVNDGTLKIDFDEAPVLYYFKYWLELEVPEGMNLRIPSSDNGDHSGFKTYTDGSLFSRHLTFATGMKPYDFDFEELVEENPVKVNVYPNPFAGTLNIELSELAGRSATVTLYSFQGYQIAQFQVDGRSETESLTFIPEQHLERGFYTLRVEYDDMVSIETVIKQ